MAMRMIALVLAGLACAGQSRRMQVPEQQLTSHLFLKRPPVGKTQSTADAKLSRRRGCATDSSVPLRSVAMLLCAVAPQGAHALAQVTPDTLKKLALMGATVNIVEKVQRGPPPPLRPILGQREEASLVDEPPPSLLKLILRAIVLLIYFLPVLLGIPLALLCEPFRERIFYRLITDSLARAGTAFIKWGQWSSTRPDMFPEKLCAALSRLHSQAPTHSYQYTRQEVEKAMLKPLSDSFDFFEKKPIASGSIAQVHRAKLNGTFVAVKVRHPRVVSRIVTDFVLMRGLVDWLSWLAPGINIKSSVDQFSSTMVAQTRLDIEGEHLKRFNWNFGMPNWRDIGFPGVLFDSRSVLIETFEPGRLMSEYTLQRSLNMGGTPLERGLAHFVVSRGEDLYLKMLLVDNLMHADLHPGNILLDISGQKPRLILLDVGMVARLTQAESDAFVGLLHAMGAGNGKRAAQVVLRFSEEQTCKSTVDQQAFQKDMQSMFAERCRGFGTNIQFGSVLRGVLTLCRKHRVSIDANYMTLVINVLCLEAMAGALLPDYNVLDAARPLLDAQKHLPRPIFYLAIPLIRRLKGLRDRAWFHSTRNNE